MKKKNAIRFNCLLRAKTPLFAFSYAKRQPHSRFQTAFILVAEREQATRQDLASPCFSWRARWGDYLSHRGTKGEERCSLSCGVRGQREGAAWLKGHLLNRHRSPPLGVVTKRGDAGLFPSPFPSTFHWASSINTISTWWLFMRVRYTRKQLCHSEVTKPRDGRQPLRPRPRDGQLPVNVTVQET